MQKYSILTKLRHILSRSLASVVYYSRALKLVSFLVNHCHTQKDAWLTVAVSNVNRKRSCKLQILVYHRVNDENDRFFPGTPTAVFAAQMDYLASNWSVLALEDAVEGLRGGGLPRNAIAVTFDDGYKDNYVNAFPILKRLSIPATVFLAVGSIGSGQPLWHDRVFVAFRETRVKVLRGFGGKLNSYSLRTEEERLFAQREILKSLWSMEDHERYACIDELGRRLRVDDAREAPDLMLSWDEVRIMRQNGITFGSHTVTHPILARTSQGDAMREIRQSKEVIERNVGQPVTSFAYPVGRRQDYSEGVKCLLRDAGYACALTMLPGVNREDQDLFEMRRVTAWETHIPAFAVKLTWHRVRENRGI